MGTIIKKKKKKQYYYYYVESARVNGKPRIVNQRYLGRAEKIIRAFDAMECTESPLYSLVYDFGAVCALYELARELKIIELIDTYSPKRDQGLSIGEYMFLAAVNRALAPCSKAKFANWYNRTFLYHLLPAQKSWLSSKRFWDNMILEEETITKIEDELSAAIVNQYNIATDCLIYDTTNFFTYVDTKTQSQLLRRGKCKSKRTDLKIVGLAMLLSPDFKIPLFHETYPGNLHDAQEFHRVIDKMKQRLARIGAGEKRVTIIFDKGNNSLDNMDKIFDVVNSQTLHIVGSLKFNEHKKLWEVPKSEFSPVKGYEETSVTAYRLKKTVYNREMTVVITHNPNLLEGQLQGLKHNIKKCAKELKELQNRLIKRKRGIIKKGKKPTIQSVQKNTQKILGIEYMQDVFTTNISEDKEGFVVLDFNLDSNNLEYVTERYLGKTLLFTDNHDWSTAKIISAYRSMHHIENTFRQMKDTSFLSFKPFFHWTDQKIRVHAFYCVLALRLCFLLKKKLHEQGLKMSVNAMLSLLSDIKQVITIFSQAGDPKKNKKTYSLTRLSSEQKKVAEVLNILKYKLGG